MTDVMTHFPKLIFTNDTVAFVVMVNDELGWKYYAYSTILIAGSCTFNVFLSYKIVSHLRAHRATLRPSTYRLHILLTVCLLLQVKIMLRKQVRVFLRLRNCLLNGAGRDDIKK